MVLLGRERAKCTDNTVQSAPVPALVSVSIRAPTEVEGPSVSRRCNMIAKHDLGSAVQRNMRRSNSVYLFKPDIEAPVTHPLGASWALQACRGTTKGGLTKGGSLDHKRKNAPSVCLHRSHHVLHCVVFENIHMLLPAIFFDAQSTSQTLAASAGTLDSHQSSRASSVVFTLRPRINDESYWNLRSRDMSHRLHNGVSSPQSSNTNSKSHTFRESVPKVLPLRGRRTSCPSLTPLVDCCSRLATPVFAVRSTREPPLMSKSTQEIPCRSRVKLKNTVSRSSHGEYRQSQEEDANPTCLAPQHQTRHVKPPCRNAWRPTLATRSKSHSPRNGHGFSSAHQKKPACVLKSHGCCCGSRPIRPQPREIQLELRVLRTMEN